MHVRMLYVSVSIKVNNTCDSIEAVLTHDAWIAIHHPIQANLQAARHLLDPATQIELESVTGTVWDYQRRRQPVRMTSEQGHRGVVASEHNANSVDTRNSTRSQSCGIEDINTAEYTTTGHTQPRQRRQQPTISSPDENRRARRDPTSQARREPTIVAPRPAALRVAARPAQRAFARPLPGRSHKSARPPPHNTKQSIIDPGGAVAQFNQK